MLTLVMVWWGLGCCGRGCEGVMVMVTVMLESHYSSAAAGVDFDLAAQVL